MDDKPKNYLFVEQPDRTAKIDFAEFRTTDGTVIEEVSVTVTLAYNSRTGKPELTVCAKTGELARIALDETVTTDSHDADDPDEDDPDEHSEIE